MEVLLVAACGLVVHQHYKTKQYETIQSDTEEEIIEQPVGVSKKLVNPVTNSMDNLNKIEPSPTPLGIRVLKTHETTEPKHDEQRYNEQFKHADDPAANIQEKPWMRMNNMPYKPKEEGLNENPTPQDILGMGMTKKVKSMEKTFAMKTVPVTSEKQYDRPVEQISVGNGSATGFHYGKGKRHVPTLFSQQPSIITEEGVRGHSATGGKQHVAGLYETITQRSSLNHESIGPAVAIGVPHAAAVIPSMEITASHSETYRNVNDGKSAKGPVSNLKYIQPNSFAPSHDENIQTLGNSLVTRGSYFGTGASDERETNIHVPLNMEPTVRFDDHIIPNFTIGKHDDTVQEVDLKNPLVTELKNNTLGSNKNKKAPIVGTTVHKNSSISTQSTMLGASSRGLSFKAGNADQDGVKLYDKRSEMDKLVSDKASGISSAHVVSAMKSNESQFRTTLNLSETTPTPLIRGSGGRQGEKLNGIQMEKDTSLSEMISSGARTGISHHAKPVDTKSMNKFNSKQDNIGVNTNRDNMLAPVSKDLPSFLAKKPTGSLNASNMSVSLKKDTDVGLIQLQKKYSSSTINKMGKTETKERKLGDLLNSRLGNSKAVKNLLKNPYSKPAAPRMM